MHQWSCCRKGVLPTYLSGVTYLRSIFWSFFFTLFCNKKLEVKDHKGRRVVGGLWERRCGGIEVSQRVVSLDLQWSRFFFCFFFSSVVLCRCSWCNLGFRSDVLGRPIGRSSVEQEREWGVQGEGGKKEKKSSSCDSDHNSSMNVHRDTQMQSSQRDSGLLRGLVLGLSPPSPLHHVGF